MINNVTLVGRVGAEPEIRHFESGKVKASFRLAITRPTKEKVTDWFDVQCWDKQAEIVGEYVKKGHLVGVTGSIQEEKWEKDGQTRSKVVINANNVRLMEPKSEGQSQRKATRDDAGDIFDSEDEIEF